MSLFNGTLASRYEGGLQRLAGVALPAAAGVTFHTGALNVPVNLAVVPSKSGIRVSVLTGFNMRRE